jgi:peptidyl-prolyl cis-trans isomerase SurA
MRPLVFSFCTFALAVVLLTGCASSGPNATLATVGSERITVQEFEEAYAKNNGGWEKGAAASLEERERFLDLLIKFKLKVQEARAQGLLNDSTIQQELKSYGTSIATSYMLDKELVEPNVRKLFERKLEEVRASHILIRVNQNASPADTAAAYEKAMKALSLIPTMSFDSIAVAYSEDQSVSSNRGDLGWFTGGRMVPEFEDVAYSLPVGEYTRTPVRTQFGYHIIKVTGRRQAPGPLRISHILKRFFIPSGDDSLEVRDSSYAIYQKLKEGMDFAQAAKQYSDDQGSAAQGGDLGYFEHSRLPEHVSEALAQLPIGGFTEPIKFNYGYHIFRLTDRKPQPTFSDMERELRNQYQNSRYTTDYANYLHNLKRKYNLNYDVATLYAFTHAFDSTKTPSAAGWRDTLTTDMLGRTLFTFGSRTFRVNDIVDFLGSSAEFKTTLLTPANIENIVERFTEIKLLEEASADVPRRHPNFAKLMKEYEDGILLFRIEQDEVWNKVVPTDSALRAYYEEHKESFRWPDRINIQEILTETDSVARAAYWRLQYGEDFGEVAAELTIRPTMNEKRGIWGLMPADSRDMTKKGWTMAVDSICPPFQANEGWAIIKVLQKDSARVKTFEEALPEITSAYREYATKLREQQWVEELKQKYGVRVRRELLSEVFRRKSGETP